VCGGVNLALVEILIGRQKYKKKSNFVFQFWVTVRNAWIPSLLYFELVIYNHHAWRSSVSEAFRVYRLHLKFMRSVLHQYTHDRNKYLHKIYA
jgi:hypothetical protein